MNAKQIRSLRPALEALLVFVGANAGLAPLTTDLAILGLLVIMLSTSSLLRKSLRVVSKPSVPKNVRGWLSPGKESI